MTAQQLSVMLSGLGDNEVAIKVNDSSIYVTGIEIGFNVDSGKIFLTTDSEVMLKDI